MCLSKPHPAGDPVMPPLTRVGCWSSSAPPSLTTRPPCSASSLQHAWRHHRALITVGPGGVGQSLNTCLIANLFGGSHGFMDMNVFQTEDKLRTQADTFTGKVNIRGVTYSAHCVFLRSSSLARRPPAPTNGSTKTFVRR